MPFLLMLFALALPLNATASPRKLIIVGDSLTEGYGVRREQAYPALLQKKIDDAGFKDWQVINSGISGSTSASAHGRVQWALKQKPALLLLALGANDGLRGQSVKSMEENLAKALTACQKADVKVILLGMRMPPNYGAAYAKDFQRAYQHLAARLNVPLLPFFLEGVAAHPELNLADGIHPNEKGQAIVAETVFQFLRKFL